MKAPALSRLAALALMFLGAPVAAQRGFTGDTVLILQSNSSDGA